MPAVTPAALLRPDALAGRAVAATGPYAGACAALGATVVALAADPLDEDALAAAAAAAPRVDTLVVDAAAAFGAGGLAGLRAAVDGAFLAARAVATAHWVDRAHGGKIVLVAPRPDAGEHAEPARAALENVARSLSVEWARFDVRATVVAPGPAVTQDDLASFVAFLASRAGDYYSGCRFDLGRGAGA